MFGWFKKKEEFVQVKINYADRAPSEFPLPFKEIKKAMLDGIKDKYDEWISNDNATIPYPAFLITKLSLEDGKVKSLSFSEVLYVKKESSSE